MTWKIPLRTIFSGSMPLIFSPMNSMVPLVTSPSSLLRRPEMALRVVDLPAPLAPRRVVIFPSSQEMDRPLRTRITSL